MTTAVTDSADLLKTAVHQNKALSRQGVLERLFTLWFKGFVYNQIWEDPRVDAQALELGEHSRVLTISSAGCNVLNYLVHKPASITAVDLNPCHMHLARLRIEAMRRLPTHDDFFNFFGHGDKKHNLVNYKQHIRQHLPGDTRAFWEGGKVRRSLRRSRIRYFAKGIYDHAKFGYFMRFVHLLAKVTQRDPSRLFAATSVQEQDEIFRTHIAPFFDNRFVRMTGRIPVILYSMGIPPQQYRLMHEQSNGNVVDLYRDRVRRLACDFPLEDNYFAWQAFARSYDHQHRLALPDYLKAEHHATIRANLDRVDTHITSLTEHLRHRQAGSLNSFVFLDAQDWMTPSQLEDLWTQIARVGQPGSRIIFRTASDASPIETGLSPELRSRFHYERERSKAFYDQDRSAIYGGFHLYVMKH